MKPTKVEIFYLLYTYLQKENQNEYSGYGLDVGDIDYDAFAEALDHVFFDTSVVGDFYCRNCKTESLLPIHKHGCLHLYCYNCSEEGRRIARKFGLEFKIPDDV